MLVTMQMYMVCFYHTIDGIYSYFSVDILCMLRLTSNEFIFKDMLGKAKRLNGHIETSVIDIT